MTPTLVLADDSVAVQRLVESAFGEAGMRVICVGGGREAVDCITRERPAVVLADANLADRNGYELAAHVSRIPELAHIPVVLLVGAFDQVDERRVQAAGCAAVLSKPFEPHMAVLLVEDLLAARGGGLQRPVGAPSGPTPAGRVIPAPSSSSLDEYFDRLDEALAGQPAPRPPAVAPAVAPAAAATAAAPVRGTPPPAVPARGTPPPAVPLHEVFTQFLDAEVAQAGDLDAETVRHAPPAGEPPPAAVPAAETPSAVSEELVEAVTARVLERLGDTYVRTLVSAAVRDAAERLVREAVDRISSEE
jgi:CheY-like chemotaxis protein